MTVAPGTLLFTRSDVARLLTLDRAIAAVEHAFGQLGRGEVPAPAILGVHAQGGGFHIKAALLAAAGGGEQSNAAPRRYFAVKSNANFPGNPARAGLPAIQGVVLLCDAADGRLLALLDSMELTALRTAAASAVAAGHLARRDSRVATICGCGVQGRAHLRALLRVLPLERVFACDAQPQSAQRFAAEMSAETGVRAEPAAALLPAARQSDVVVTCTPSRRPLLAPGDLRPGTFLAAVGADHPEKQELAPALLREAKLVVDSLDQCAAIGELHHALAASILSRGGVHAELAEIVAGLKPGRTSAEEIVIFDSTGVAIADAAAAIAIYESAQPGTQADVRFDA